ncbi:Uncharacterised protein [Burkholderia pseudomallei]|nr:Uncharacterised protein [Burkholderia pseudomallei]
MLSPAVHLTSWSGLVRLQPAIAEIVALLVRQQQLLVDDRRGPRAEHVQHEARRVLAVGRDGYRQRVELLHVRERVRLREADAREHRGRPLVEQRRALERPRDVVGRERIARMEREARAQLEREREAVGTHAPRLRDVAVEFRRIGEIDAHQPVVCIRDVFLRHELVDFTRIERDELVEQRGHHEQVFRRRRVRFAGRDGRERGSGGERRDELGHRECHTRSMGLGVEVGQSFPLAPGRGPGAAGAPRAGHAARAMRATGAARSARSAITSAATVRPLLRRSAAARVSRAARNATTRSRCA